jgi:Holliday junction resolvase RusA-like endonuclease
LSGTFLPQVKPDADNLMKTVDSLNEVVFRDDKQITDATISKRYSDRPRLRIEILGGGE